MSKPFKMAVSIVDDPEKIRLPAQCARACIIQTDHYSKFTLSGEALPEYKYYVLGFVPADVVRLKEDVWFEKLDSERVMSVDEFLNGSLRAWTKV